MPEEFQGSIPSSSFISGNRFDGWYLAITDISDFQRKVLHWTRVDQDVELITLPNEAFFINLSWGFQGLVGNRFILGGAGNAYSAVNVVECDKSTGAKLDTFQFGDNKTGASFSALLSSGGLAGVSFQEADSYRRVSCHAFYRKPEVPSVPPYSKWWAQKFDFELPREGTGDSNLPGLNAAAVEGPDGKLYVFMVRDGLGEIWALAFDILPDRLVPSAGFPKKITTIGNGPLSVQGEMPVISAACDRRHNSIVLAYQNELGFPAACGNNPNLSYHSIAEWKLGTSLNLLGTTEFMGSHRTASSIGIFVRPDGVYFLMEDINLQTCGTTWNIGLCTNGETEVLASWGDSRVQALSPDGWVLVYDSARATTRLEKIQFRPEMRIRERGGDLILDWDESSNTDVLQRSTDLKAWTDDGYVGLPPVIRHKTGDAMFWRVRRA